MLEALATIATTFLAQIIAYLPQFFAGLFIALLGLVVGSLLKQLILVFFKVLKLEKWLEESNLAREKDVKVWPGVLAELIRWSAIILFLIPAVETWGLPRATEVLNQLLLFLPNIIVAVFIGFVGVAVANLLYDIVRHTVKGIEGTSATALATFARYATLFFTALIVLNQLGVAADLIRILFTGIVVMVALAGGLAFGLGGKDIASEMLRELKDKLTK